MDVLVAREDVLPLVVQQTRHLPTDMPGKQSALVCVFSYLNDFVV